MIMVIENCNLIGKDHRTSKKGNNYDVILISKDMETMQFMLPKDCSIPFDMLKELTPYDVLIDVRRFGKSYTFRMLDIYNRI